MTSTTTKRSTTGVATTAADSAGKRWRGKGNLPTVQEDQQLPNASSSSYSGICTYWAAYPAFDPQRMLLRRLFSINANKTKYVSFWFYPARDYLALVEFGVMRSCGSKSIFLTGEQVYTLAQCLPTFADAICKEGKEEKPIKWESVSFRLNTPMSRRGLTRLYLGTEYKFLTPLYLHYFAWEFNIVHHKLRDYVLVLPDILSYVKMSFTSIVYLEPMPKANTHINYPHLHEKLVSFV